MFALSDEDLGRTILGCGDGPASSNAEATQRGYINASLPALPFANSSFDLALCSHFLFLYSEHLDESFHHEALLEMLRVAAEVRIFPLLALGGARSPFVDGCVTRLLAAGYRVTIEAVPYEFQRGGNEMMRVRPAGAVSAMPVMTKAELD